jgi:hypothetical protein
MRNLLLYLGIILGISGTLNAADVIINNTSAITLWDTPQTINGNVIIESCATLKITNTTKMGAEYAIFVKRGGRLEVINGTITSITDDNTQPWRGIQVWGNTNEGQTTIGAAVNGGYAGAEDQNCNGNKQGVAYFKFATVKYSSEGILAGRPNHSFHGGGIIISQWSNFEYNGKATFDFSPYRRALSASRITGNTFGDSERPSLLGIPANVSRIRLQEIEGVTINQNYADLGGGSTDLNHQFVKAHNAGYNAFNNEIEGGLGYNSVVGFLNSSSAGATSLIHINSNNFDLLTRCIASVGTDNLMITHNDFFTRDGVFLNGCKGFTVEENTFPAASDAIIVQDCGYLGDEIYNNFFGSFDDGIKAQQNNIGLQMRCNQMVNGVSDHDIIVTSLPGVANQGINTTGFQRAAKNTFSHTCFFFPTSDFHQNSGLQDIRYRYRNEPNEMPQCKSGSVINDQVTLDESSCLDRIGEEVMENPDLAGLESAISEFGGSISNGGDVASNYSEGLYSSTNPDDIYLRELLRERTMLYQRYFNSLLRFGQVNQAITYLHGQDNEDARMLLIPLLIAQGDYTVNEASPNATDELAKINSNFPEVADFKSWYNFILDIESDSTKNYDSLSAGDLSFVQNMAQANTRMAYKAKALLALPQYGGTLDFNVEDWDGTNNKRAIDPASQFAEAVQISTYPNPVTDNLSIEYHLGAGVQDGFVKIYNLNKVEVYQQSFKANGQNILNVNTSDWAAGIYVIEYGATKAETQRTKIIVQP